MFYVLTIAWCALLTPVYSYDMTGIKWKIIKFVFYLCDREKRHRSLQRHCEEIKILPVKERLYYFNLFVFFSVDRRRCSHKLSIISLSLQLIVTTYCYYSNSYSTQSYTYVYIYNHYVIGFWTEYVHNDTEFPCDRGYHFYVNIHYLHQGEQIWK